MLIIGVDFHSRVNDAETKCDELAWCEITAQHAVELRA